MLFLDDREDNIGVAALDSHDIRDRNETFECAISNIWKTVEILSGHKTEMSSSFMREKCHGKIFGS